ncbi:MAG TPA: NAD(P)/FAD-dependent oxidoreductase [Candidatus Limnocylindrales bacterium]|nr:NAD(P)/FAD-dependent oxidoreductase [Candidatus Limnocylindrales bacterium]
MNHFDVIVVGAGPAGLSAAAAASEAGRSVLLLDAADRPGGQFWRHRLGSPPAALQRLLKRLRRVNYRPGSPVWWVEPGFGVYTPAASFTGDRLVLATGAYDRVIPFPGWDLPGVVTAGGAQALLKGQGVAVGRRVVVAGAGPFLLPVAVGLARAGVAVLGVFEAGRPHRYLRHTSAVPKGFEALGYGVSLLRHRIPYHTGKVVTAAHGTDRLEAVTVAGRTIECDALAVGYGFTPQIELAVALGCETTLDSDGSLVVSRSVPDLFVAGEITGVGGAVLAVVEGTLAGLAAADRPAPNRLLRKQESLRRFASAMTAIHPVPQLDFPDDVVVCRCEGVTAGAIRAAVAESGAIDTRGVKLMARPGMGWCQGRVCGFATARLTADSLRRDVTAADLATYAHRPIAQPVTLGEMSRTELPPAELPSAAVPSAEVSPAEVPREEMPRPPAATEGHDRAV